MNAPPWPGYWLHAASLYLTAARSAPGAARSFVRRQLEFLSLSELVDDGTVVMSELVTNAVEAIGQAERLIGVQMRVADSGCYLEVWDDCATVPARRQAADDAECGRGLLLVEALCCRWGVAWPGTGGKVVWAELAVETPPHQRLRPACQASPAAIHGHRADAALRASVVEGLLGSGSRYARAVRAHTVTPHRPDENGDNE